MDKKKPIEQDLKKKVLKEKVSNVFSTAEGFEVLKFIKKLSGNNVSSIVRKGDYSVSVEDMLIREGQRLVWVILREHLSDDLLKRIGGE